MLNNLHSGFGAIYKDNIPMVCHNEMDKAYVDELARVIAYEGVPPLADFGGTYIGDYGTTKTFVETRNVLARFF